MTLNQRIALALIVAKLMLEAPGVTLESLDLNEAQPFIRFTVEGQNFAGFLAIDRGSVSFRFGSINGAPPDEADPAARFLDMLVETRSSEIARQLRDLLTDGLDT